MAKISIKTTAQSQTAPLPAGLSGNGRAKTYFAGTGHPLHLHLIELVAGQHLILENRPVDQLAYIWYGEVGCEDYALESGSSIIVEHGESADLVAKDNTSILVFSAADATGPGLAGGHVHLLPKERAPRSDNLDGVTGLVGVMHADADCPTCAIWLHENLFPGSEATRQDAEAGIHSHSEHEIIFVLGGDIRLGGRLYGPGTAVAIAADTLYSFAAGPEGLHFANFRAAKPGNITFASGHSISETAYWRERLPRPEYITPIF